MILNSVRGRFVHLAVIASMMAYTAQSSAGDSAVAEALFDEGKRLMREGAIAAACKKLAASWEEEESVGTMLNLARCNEKLGKTATAFGQYQTAARLADKLDDAKRADIARDLAEVLKGTLAHVTITVPSPADGMQVHRNGTLIRPAAFGIAVAVDPGPQRIVATAPGMSPWTADLVIGPSDNKTVSVPLLVSATESTVPSVPGSASTATPSPRPAGGAAQTEDEQEGLGGLAYAGIAISVLGAGGVAAGVALGAMASSDKDAALALCPDNGCNAAGFELVESARGKATGSTIGFVVGGAALTAGVLMIVLGQEDSPDITQGLFVLPSCSLVGCRVVAGGAF